MSARKHAVFWLTTVAIFILVIWVFSNILLPFIAGAGVAYFLDPPTDKLETRGLSRALSASIIISTFFVLIILVILLLIPILHSQISGFSDRLPDYVFSLRNSVLPFLVGLTSQIGIDLSSSSGFSLKEITADTVSFGFTLLSQAWSGGLAIFNITSLLIITPVVAFYLLRDFDRMTSVMDGWLPRRYTEIVRHLFRQIDTVLAGFIRGQGTVCLILAIFYAVSLTLVGLEFGLIIGLFSGLVSFIPLIGVLLGFALSMLTALTQFLPEGDRIGLHPVWLMFSLLAGGALFGLVGVLIAVPAAAAIGVIIRFTLTQYLNSPLYLGEEEVGRNSNKT